jgi:hypothetical protein
MVENGRQKEWPGIEDERERPSASVTGCVGWR